VRFEITPCLVDIELGEWGVVRPWPRDQDVIDRCGQLGKEVGETLEVQSVEHRSTCTDLSTGLTQSIRIARADDDVGSALARETSRLEDDVPIRSLLVCFDEPQPLVYAT
jgi:hypothetical protein